MFEAAGYRVALAVSPVGPALPDGPVPAGVERRRSRLTDVLRPAGFDDAGVADELSRITDVRSQLAAYEAALVVRLAELRPDHLDVSSGRPGAAADGWVSGQAFPGISEFFVDELAAVLNCSRRYAQDLASTSLVLRRQLPATWAALADGRLDWPRARALADVLGWQSPAVAVEVIAECEAELLPRAMGLTVGRLKATATRVLLRRDATATDRRRSEAERAADVRAHPTADGMGELVGEMPLPLAMACRDAVDRYARMAKADGDERPIGQLRAGVLADLILRPWDTSRPPVTADLTVLAPLPTLRDGVEGGTEPADVCGEPITAGHLREVLTQLDAVCPGGLQAPTGGSLQIALIDRGTGALRATVSRPELQRLARRDGDTVVLDRPAAVRRYTPTPAQRRFIERRDRICRHPGCGRSTAWTDADHVVPYANGGDTDCANLCCLCRRHHRLKTHAPHWQYRMTADGVLTVTTPSGVTRVTRPPGTQLPEHPELTAVEVPRPRQHAVPEDPPPF